MSKLTDSAVGPVPVFPHKVEIKKLTKSFGHEGPSYNCEVWIDGKKACQATEEGGGGGVMLHWFDKKAEKLVDDYAKTCPRNDLYDPEDRAAHIVRCREYAETMAAKTVEEATAYELHSCEFQALDYLHYAHDASRDERDACDARIKELKALHPEGLEAPDPDYMFHTMYADDFIDEWVNDWIEDADMRKRCKKAICYHTPDQGEAEYWVSKIPFTEGAVAKILAKDPGAEIYNLKFGKPLPDTEAPAPPTESLGLTKEMAAQLNGCLNEIRLLHRAQDEPKSPLAKKGWKPMPFKEKIDKENDIWARLEKLQKDLGPGFRVGKLINFSVADGRAHYLVLKIGKSLTELAWLPFGDAWQADAVEIVDKVVGGKRKRVHQCLTSIAKRQCLAYEGLKAMCAGAKA